MASLELVGVQKSFDRTAVLRGINLTINDGEFISLVGPSGCGKSTLLRIIAGLETQSAGDVLIDGRNVNAVKSSQRDLSMVFQSYALYPHLSVADNIAVPLRMRRLGFWGRLPVARWLLPSTWATERAIRADIEQVSALLGMETLLERKPGQLSGGQRQRVAVGRAIVRDMPPNKAANEIILADFYKKNPNKQTAVDQLPLLRDWMAYPGDNGLAITQVIYDGIEAIVVGDQDDMRILQEEMIEEVNDLLPRG